MRSLGLTHRKQAKTDGDSGDLRLPAVCLMIDNLTARGKKRRAGAHEEKPVFLVDAAFIYLRVLVLLPIIVAVLPTVLVRHPNRLGLCAS